MSEVAVTTQKEVRNKIRNSKESVTKAGLFIIASLLALLFIAPIVIVFMNSFKGKFFISDAPFMFPSGETFVGMSNYISGITKTGFPQAFGWSLWITLFSVGAIVLFTSMTAWFIIRVKNIWTKTLYYLFVFSMIVPFQMVMFTLTYVSNNLRLDNPVVLS